MKWVFGPALLVACSLAVAGCSTAVSPIASAPPPVAAPAPVVYGSFLDGATGQTLGQADKDRALAAQEEALASGQRKTWKGDKGVFGYVEPGAAPAAPADGVAGSVCRAFTSTIYIGGRPQVGHGRGCQGPDGTYRMVG